MRCERTPIDDDAENAGIRLPEACIPLSMTMTCRNQTAGGVYPLVNDDDAENAGIRPPEACIPLSIQGIFGYIK